MERSNLETKIYISRFQYHEDNHYEDFIPNYAKTVELSELNARTTRIPRLVINETQLTFRYE